MSSDIYKSLQKGLNRTKKMVPIGESRKVLEESASPLLSGHSKFFSKTIARSVCADMILFGRQ
jgi:hypothetical protein